ncbi:hypothetical protein DYB25_004668 [Aphanomyces astaci]|uniref:Globin family profile domain-containing protein n=1 Tax=Aphanomyces astaci TaxID=112090 RepID=A0A397AZ54_APHAT|nr:hypothetical protein DYB25_004668 [Aphanomyces astaci]RHY14668.1 hypothetical protein DYB36_011079 [Aphanomyces astaci]RHY49381.1 hypothetical protein DYB30_011126 [Aphanomyces astaci]RHY61891.1 hypothetical protein DYB38_012004 [Aphanomyces astaci]RHZ17787.1 hypothetical protein DYB31_004825 [Aphanomyces astaci]
MGNSSRSSLRQHGKVIHLRAHDAGEDVDLDLLSEYSFGLAMDHEVQHYMPPQLPLLPMLTKARIDICTRTWDKIRTAGTEKMKSYGKPGIVLFYDEFFYRLFQRDSTFRTVFANAKERAEVLIKALMFMLSMRGDSPQSIANMQNRCRFLGHKHRGFPLVRPHHFATYTMTAIEVMMYWMGDEASVSVADAWSNVVGFVLRYLLEPYLCDRTDPYEYYQNTTIAAVREITESSNGGGSSVASSVTSMHRPDSKMSSLRDAAKPVVATTIQQTSAQEQGSLRKPSQMRTTFT